MLVRRILMVVVALSIILTTNGFTASANQQKPKSCENIKLSGKLHAPNG